MKLAIAIASLAAFVSAHGFVGIAAPAPQTTFSPGEQFAVNLERMVRLSRGHDIAFPG